MKRSSLALVAKLDRESAGRIEALWARLADLGHEDTPARLGMPAHITLAILDRTEAIEDSCRQFLEALRGGGPIAVTFTALGIFPAHREDYYFLTPAACEPLQALHGRLHAQLDKAGLEPAKQTRPGLWTPHCSLSEGVRENRAGQTLSLLQKDWSPIPARLDRVALIAFPPAEELAERAL